MKLLLFFFVCFVSFKCKVETVFKYSYLNSLTNGIKVKYYKIQNRKYNTDFEKRKEKGKKEREKNRLHLNNADDIFNMLTSLRDDEIKKYKEIKREKKKNSGVTYIQKLPKKNLLLQKWKNDLFENIKKKLKQDEEFKKKTTLCRYKYKLPIDFFKLGDSLRGKIISVENHLIKVDINSIHLAHLYIKRYFTDKSKIKEKYQIGKYIDVVICYIHKRNKIIQVTDNEQEIQLLRENLQKLQGTNEEEVNASNLSQDGKDGTKEMEDEEEEKEEIVKSKEQKEQIVKSKEQKEQMKENDNNMTYNAIKYEKMEANEKGAEKKEVLRNPLERYGVEFRTNESSDDLMYVKGKNGKKRKEITEYKIEDIVNGKVQFINEEGAYIDIGCNTLAFLNLGHYNRDPNHFFKPVKKKRIEVNDFLKNLRIRKIDILNNRIEVSFYSLEEEACLRLLNQQETLSEQNKYMPCAAYINYNYHMIHYVKKYNELKKQKKGKNSNITNLFEKDEHLEELNETKHLRKKDFNSFMLKYNELSSPNSNYKEMFEHNEGNWKFFQEIHSGNAAGINCNDDSPFEKNEEIELEHLRKQNELLKQEINKFKENEAAMIGEGESGGGIGVDFGVGVGVGGEVGEKGEKGGKGGKGGKENEIKRDNVRFQNVNANYNISSYEKEKQRTGLVHKYNDYFSYEEQTEEEEEEEEKEEEEKEKEEEAIKEGDYFLKQLAKEREEGTQKKEIKEKNFALSYLKKNLPKIKKEFSKDMNKDMNEEKKENSFESEDTEEQEENRKDIFRTLENIKKAKYDKENDSKPFYDVKDNLDYILKQNINLNFMDDEEKCIDEASKLFGEDIRTWEEKMYYYFGNRDKLTLEDEQIYNVEEFEDHLMKKKENTFDQYEKLIGSDSNSENFSDEASIDSSGFLTAKFGEEEGKEEKKNEEYRDRDRDRKIKGEAGGEREEGEEGERNSFRIGIYEGEKKKEVTKKKTKEEKNDERENGEKNEEVEVDAFFHNEEEEEEEEKEKEKEKESIENYLNTFLNSGEEFEHKEAEIKAVDETEIKDASKMKKDKIGKETKQQDLYFNKQGNKNELEFANLFKNVKEDKTEEKTGEKKFLQTKGKIEEKKEAFPVEDINMNKIINKAVKIGRAFQKRKLEKLLQQKENEKEYRNERDNFSKVNKSDSSLKNNKIVLKNESEKLFTESEKYHQTIKEEQDEADEKQLLANNTQRNNYDELQQYKYASYEVQGYYKRKRSQKFKTAEELSEVESENQDNNNIILSDTDIIGTGNNRDNREKEKGVNTIERDNENHNIHNLDNMKDLLLLYGEKDYMTESTFLEKILEKEKHVNKNSSKEIDQLIKQIRYSQMHPEEWLHQNFPQEHNFVGNSNITTTTMENRVNIENMENKKKQENKTQAEEYIKMHNFMEKGDNSKDLFRNNLDVNKHTDLLSEPSFTSVESLQLKDMALQMGLIKHENVELNDKELVDMFLKNKKFQRALKFYKINFKNATVSSIYKITKMLYFERPFPRKEKRRRLHLNEIRQSI